MKALSRYKKGDLLLISLVAIIVSISVLWTYIAVGKTSDKLTAVVIRDGKRIEQIDLTKLKEPHYIKLEDNLKVTILAEPGNIKFIEADCPDKICIKTGTLTKPGDRAVCLPSKTIVMIEEAH